MSQRLRDTRSVGTCASLTVEGISHSFHVPGSGRFFRASERQLVLRDISFTVSPGTLTALLGPSGCGKTTLLRILAGLITPDAGSARASNLVIAGTPGGAAYHPQDDALMPWLCVLDNATLGAEVSGASRELVRRRALELLDRFGLSGHESAWPDELSGGMRQRVALMRTFLMPQPVVLLDEPFSALDALTRKTLHHWLLEIIACDQRPTLLVTHDIDEALLLADQILVFSNRPGEVVHVERRPAREHRLVQREEGSDRPAANRLMRVLGA